MLRRSDRPLADGYYLSTYLSEPGAAFLLSTSTRHDNNISLWHKDGLEISLVRYWELERFTGVKHYGFATEDQARASAALDRLLAEEGLSLADIRECWGSTGISAVDVDVSTLYRDITLPYHSICHVYSAALLDGLPGAGRTVLAFAVDGGPDFDLDIRQFEHWYAGGLFRDGDVELFPVDSPAPLYHVAAERYGMEEGTLMALAGASPACVNATGLRDEVLKTVRFLGRAAYGEATAIVEEIDSLAREHLAGAQLPGTHGLDDEQHLVSAVMKEVQLLSEGVMMRNVDDAVERCHLDTSATELALAGGYALNCPTNSLLMNHYGFSKLLAPPCVNDTGQSLGIGLATIAARCDHFRFQFPGAYLGAREQRLEQTLADYAAHITDVRPADLDQAVTDLRREPIAWLQGHAELGPRALGNRSLLADPGSQQAKDKLNEVKRRQPWRPVAPVVKADRVSEWFDDARPSPYMLETFDGKANTREHAPAVLHLDGTARVQTVSAQQNPRLHDLLDRFEAVTGVPILCNTSLNDKGEPIVQTAAEALNFCLRKGITVAYLDDLRVQLDGSGFPADQPASRPLADIAEPHGDPAQVRSRHNPHGLEELYLHLWLRVPELKTAYDPTRAEDLAALREHADRWLTANTCTLSWWGTGFATRDRYLDALDDRGFAIGLARSWRSLRH